MKNRKICMMEFREYEGAAFTEYLNEMAAQGWFMTRFFNGYPCFERGEPGTRRYLAVAKPGTSAFDSEQEWETMKFRESYEEAGWKLQCSRICWQIFYRDGNEAGEEDGEQWEQAETAAVRQHETSIEEQEAALKELKRTSLSFGKVASIFLLLVLWGNYLSRLLQNPGEAFASNQSILTLLLMLVAIGGYLVQLAAAAWWYRRAETCLRQSGVLPKVSLRKIVLRSRINVCVVCAVVLLLLLYVVSGMCEVNGIGRSEFLMISLSIFAMFGVCSLIIHFFKEHGAGDRKDKIIGYVVVSFLVCILFMAVTTGMAVRVTENDSDRQEYRRQAEFPLDFPELGFAASTQWYRRSDRSVLGAYQREAGSRIGLGKGATLELEYYENRIPAVLAGTRDFYLKEKSRRGYQQVSEEELFRDGAFCVMHYQYQWEDADVREKPSDIYVLSDKNRLFILNYRNGATKKDEQNIRNYFTNRESVLY